MSMAMTMLAITSNSDRNMQAEMRMSVMLLEKPPILKSKKRLDSWKYGISRARLTG